MLLHFHRIIVFLVTMASIVGCVTIQDRLSGGRSVEEIVQAAADYYVKDGRDDSCVIACVTAKGVVRGAAGAADEHSLFRIASLSKLYMHLVVLNLVREGRIDLDRPVTFYSQLGLPPEYSAVTLRDLLDNRSGLPREFMILFDPRDTWLFLCCGLMGSHIYCDFDTREQFVEKTWRPWWRRCLRQKREIYSNMGFGLLGMVLEDALEMSLEKMLQEELGRPLHLEDTTFDPEPLYANRLTRACAGQVPWFTRRGREVPDNRLGSALRATGGLFSSISDCEKVFSAYWDAIEAQMRARSIDAYDDDAVFGLLRVKVLSSGRRILYRAGMIYGGASFVGFDPVDRRIVIVLRNVTSWPDKRAFAILEALQNMR